MLVLITRLKFSEESSCENTSNAPFLLQVLFLSKTALAIRSISGRLYHGQRSKKKKKPDLRLPFPFRFIQARQTLEISFPFPPLIFFLSLAWTSGPATWSINERLLCLLFALSSFRIKLLPSANSSNAVSQRFHRKPSVFWSPWQSNVLSWLRSLSSMFLANFSSRWLLGVFFYPRRQCCDRSRRG